MRLRAFIAILGTLALAACETAPSPPKTSATAQAKIAAPPKYIETGTRLTTDHPQVYPGIGVMSQGALQDAEGDHTGPGYNQTGLTRAPQ
jgi:hypothetical protein